MEAPIGEKLPETSINYGVANGLGIGTHDWDSTTVIDGYHDLGVARAGIEGVLHVVQDLPQLGGLGARALG